MNVRLDRLCAEPFRLFFPLAFLSSLIGVSLWPLALGGYLDYYPLEAHTRWMITGFGGCLIVGFIGTAGPRLLEAESWSRFELLWHYALALIILTLLAFAKVPTADLLSGFWFLGVLGSMVARLLFDRHDVPPPGLSLAFLALLTGIVSCFALSLHSRLGLSYPWLQFWHSLYFQGFLWLPILGVAPYILPRFFGKSSPHSFPESETLPPGWLKHWLFSIATGVILLSSFAVEIWGSPRAGLILRAVVTILHLAFFVPGLFSLGKINALALSLRWIPWCAAGGWILASSFLHLRIGILHLMFIGGAATVMLAVATRVILGHNDRHDRLATPLRWYHVVWSMLLLTAATRLSADFIPKVRTTHLGYAAGLWIIIILFWAFQIRREVKMPLPDPATRGRCPKRSRKR
jgi:uncharacterized protein involved in response to NO